jgi:hypothetical protein
VYKPTYEELFLENYFLKKDNNCLILELQAEKQRSAEATDLPIMGEAMRSQMMLNAILDGVIPNCGQRQ